MPRIAETPGKPAHHRIQVLLNDDDMAVLEDRRGDQSASAYLRGLFRRTLGLHDADHPFTKGKLICQYQVADKTHQIYLCAQPGCTLTKEA